MIRCMCGYQAAGRDGFLRHLMTVTDDQDHAEDRDAGTGGDAPDLPP